MAHQAYDIAPALFTTSLNTEIITSMTTALIYSSYPQAQEYVSQNEVNAGIRKKLVQFGLGVMKFSLGSPHLFCL